MPRATASTKRDKSSLRINVFDGTRQPFTLGAKDSILYRIIDGNQKAITPIERKTSSLLINDLVFFDNLGDNYTVIVFADKYQQAGQLQSSSVQKGRQH